MVSAEKLHVAEMFYSLQGEGRNTGCPAVFLRLQHCNLLCGRDDASWQCDTLAVWRTGQPFTFTQIIDHWQAQGWWQHLQQGARLIITGGEPLLQQPALASFLRSLQAEQLNPAVEIETNATLVPSAALDAWVTQYNCSPKGANSGNAQAQRHNATALQALADNSKAVFKFVVNNSCRCRANHRRVYRTLRHRPRTRMVDACRGNVGCLTSKGTAGLHPVPRVSLQLQHPPAHTGVGSSYRHLMCA